jgi:hypothetical protein
LLWRHPWPARHVGARCGTCALKAVCVGGRSNAPPSVGPVRPSFLTPWPAWLRGREGRNSGGFESNAGGGGTAARWARTKGRELWRRRLLGPVGLPTTGWGPTHSQGPQAKENELAHLRSTRLRLWCRRGPGLAYGPPARNGACRKLARGVGAQMAPDGEMPLVGRPEVNAWWPWHRGASCRAAGPGSRVSHLVGRGLGDGLWVIRQLLDENKRWGRGQAARREGLRYFKPKQLGLGGGSQQGQKGCISGKQHQVRGPTWLIIGFLPTRARQGRAGGVEGARKGAFL